MEPNTVYVLESRLISMDGATQIPISECEARWHNSRLCVLYFQLCKFQFCLLAAYFISVNNCSCSDRNFGQTGGDLSFWVPYPFQRYWPHGVFHQKCDDYETFSFCVAFGRFGFFLTSTFPALKHHQPCTLLQSASHLQLSIGAFAKTKPQKLLDPTNLYESVFCSVCFFESTPST